MEYYDKDANEVVPMVSFGPKPHQEMRLDRADVLLSWLFQAHADVFRAGMCVAYDLEIPKVTRQRKAGQS